MEPKNQTWRGGTRLLLALPLLATLGCHDSKSRPAGGDGFLEIESRVDTTQPGLHLSENPVIVAVGSSLFIVFEDSRDSNVDQLYFNRSDDGGKTWLAKDVYIPAAGLGLSDIDITGAAIATTDGKTIYTFFEDNASGGDDMFVNTSHDGGMTWQKAATRVDPGNPGEAESDHPRIYCDGARAYVVWEDEINGQRDIYFARTEDAGFTWSPCERLDRDAPGSGFSSRPRLAFSGDDLYVIWEDFRGGGSETYFQHSADGGATWLAKDVPVEAGFGGNVSTKDPRIGCHGKTVYVIWRDDREGDYDVYFQRSDDAGQTWLPGDEKLSHLDGDELEYPTLAVEGQSIYVAWDDELSSTSNDDVFVNVSHDGGDTWFAEEKQLDTVDRTGDSDDIQLCIGAEAVFVAWEDDRNGLDDVYMTYSTDGGLTWLPEFPVEQGVPGSADSSSLAMACSKAGVWVAWHEDRSGELDVFVNGGQPEELEEPEETQGVELERVQQ